MKIEVKLCRSNRGAYCRFSGNCTNRIINKGDLMIVVKGSGAGGYASFPVCAKCAPEFFKMARKAEKEFKKLLNSNGN